ncbi:ATP-dependent DNA helicase PIF1-like protein [Tanacetum coccineum]
MDNQLIREALDFDIKKVRLNMHNFIRIWAWGNKENILIQNYHRTVKIRKKDCPCGSILRQILPVIPKGERPELVQACINRSELSCKVFTLTRNMRVNEYSTNGALDARKQQFNKWVLDVGDGTLPAKKKKMEMRKRGLKFPKNSSLTQQTLLLIRL